MRGSAMKWAKERDSLIAQTLAFVQSVTVKMPANAPSEFSRIGEIETVGRPVDVIKMPRVSPAHQDDLREEIRGRVAAFRAHQQRFHREREEYFKSVLSEGSRFDLGSSQHAIGLRANGAKLFVEATSSAASILPLPEFSRCRSIACRLLARFVVGRAGKAKNRDHRAENC